MKKFLLFTIILTGFIFRTNAQTFTGSSSVAISGSSACYNISVSGIPNNLTNDLGLVSVTVNITHPNVNNFDMTLKAPSGTVYNLLTMGTSGANYINTKFTHDAPELSTGSSPYSGSFRPRKSNMEFCNINNNSNIGNGTWQFCVVSNSGAGTINSVTLEFGKNGGSIYGSQTASNSITGTVPQVCTFDNYVGSTNGCYAASNTSGTNLASSVAGMNIDNNSWITFYATSSTVTIDLAVSNCQYNYGIQFAVLSSPDKINFTSIKYSAGSGAKALPNPIAPGVQTITLDGLTPGTKYYLMADGYAGDVCNYQVLGATSTGIQIIDGTTDKSLICLGDSAQLNVTGAPNIVSWSPSSGLSATNIINPKASPSVTTDYVVTATNSTSGCSVTDTVRIAVGGAVNAPSLASVDRPSICTGDGGFISLSATAGSGDSLVWYTSSCGGTKIGKGNPLVITAPVTTTTYYARWERACGSSSCVSTSITVKAAAVAPTSATVNVNNFCVGSQSTISLSAVGGSGDSLIWYSGSCGGTKIGKGTPLVITAPTISTSYFVQWESSCGNTICRNTVVNVYTNPNVSISGANSFCAGQSALLTANATAGSGTISSYQWQLEGSNISGANASTHAATVQGNYKAIVTNSNLCTDTSAVFAVTQNAIPIATITGSSSFCVGLSTVLDASGSSAGSGTITGYQWKFEGSTIAGAISSTYTATAQGDYTVVITNSNSCSAESATFSISSNANPTSTITGTNKFCTNGSTVLSAASSSAGSGTISSYQWQLNGGNIPGATLTALTVSTPGNYSVIVTNSNNCPTTSSATTVDEFENPVATVTGNTSFCSGGNSVLSAGSSTAGSGTITNYQWQFNGGNIAGANGLNYSATAGGNYSVNVSNSNGCNTTSSSFNVADNANPTATITGATNFCSNQNITLSGLTSSAGSGSISSYQWLLNGSDIAGANSSTLNITEAGNYSLRITNSNNCSTTSSAFSITVYPTPAVTNVAGTSAQCGMTDGSLTITASGGTNPLEYSINSGTTYQSGNNVFSNLSAGNYSIIVKDLNNCAVSGGNVTISNLNAPLAPTAGNNANYCSGETINKIGASSAGGTLNWYSDVTLITLIASGVDSINPTVTLGTKNYYVTETQGACVSNSSMVSITINDNPNPIISGNTAYCAGGSSVLSSTSSSAGSGTIIGYQWYKNGSAIIGETSANYTAITSGTYTLYINNSNNCNATSANFVVNENFNPVAAITGADNYCAGTSIVLDGSTSTAGSGTILSWQWKKNAIDISGATNNNYTVNAAGSYSLVVTNTNNCSSLSSSIVVAENANPVAAITGTNNFCAGLNTILSAASSSAGSGTITGYQWSFNGSDVIGATNATYTATLGGNYAVRISNSNNCSTTSSVFAVTVNPNPTANIISSEGTDPAEICAGKTISLNGNPTGGSTIYSTQVWSGNTSPLSTTNGQTVSFTTTNAQTYNLTFTVSDDKGCVGMDNYTVTVNPVPSPVINGKPIAVCAGQPIGISVAQSGGTLPYVSHYWSGTASGSLSSINSASPNFSSNTAGTTMLVYTVTDAKGCTGKDSSNVTVNSNPSINETSVLVDPSSCGTADGNITGVAVSGSGTISYNWYDNSGTLANSNASNSDLTSVVAGTYYLIATDANGCSSTSSSFDINDIGAPSPQILNTDLRVCSLEGLVIDASPNGGVGPYNYLWSGISTLFLSSVLIKDPTFSSDSSGSFTYNLKVTDDNNCIGNISLTIVVDAKVEISPAKPKICAGIELQINGSPTSGTQPYVGHAWAGAGADPSLLSQNDIVNPVFKSDNAGLFPISYTVVDSRGCSTSINDTITVDANPVTTITPNPVMVCAGDSVQLNANPTAGSGIYSNTNWTNDIAYLSDASAVNPWFKSNTAGNYKLVFTLGDDKNCYAKDSVDITVNSTPVASITPDPAVVCAGSNITLNGNPTLGNGPYTHLWTSNTQYLNRADTSEVVFNSSLAGAYSLRYTITDANSCKVSDTISVNVNALPQLFVVNGGGDFCQGSGGLNVGLSGSQTGMTYQLYHNGAVVNAPIAGSGSALNFNGPFTSQGFYTVMASVASTGCVQKMTDSVEIMMHPLPQAFSLTASNGAAYCEGEQGVQLTLNGSETGHNYQLMLNGSMFGVAVSGTGASILFSGYFTEGNYSVQGENALTTCTNAMQNTVLVTKNALPQAVSTTGGPFCEDAPGLGSASSINVSQYNNAVNGGAGTAVSWYLDSTLSLLLPSPTNQTVTSSTVHYALINDGKCNNVAELKYLVHPKTDASFLAKEFCENEMSSNLVALNGGGTWSGIGITDNAMGTFDPQISGPGTWPVSYTILNEYLCVSASSLAITVFSKPSISILAVPAICSNASPIMLSGSPMGGTWSGAAIVDSSVGSFDPSLATGSAVDVYYSIVDANNCSNTETSTIAVKIAPMAPLVNDTTFVCEGAGIYNLQANGNAPIWMDNTQTTVLGNGFSFNTGNSLPGAYSYFVKDTLNGCESPSIEVVLVVNEAGMAPNLLKSTFDFCEGEEINALSSGSINGVIEWYADKELTQLLGKGEFIPSSNTGASIYYLIERVGNCPSKSDSILVTIHANPIANFTYSSGTIVAPQNVIFTDSSMAADASIVAYSWVLPDGKSVNGSRAQYYFTKEGTYELNLLITDGFGCQSQVNQEVVVLSKEGIDLANVFTPNGDGKNDYFTIDLDAFDDATVIIYNRWGAPIFEFGLGGAWDGNTSTGNEAPRGTYFFVVNASKNGAVTTKQGVLSLLR